MLSLLTCLRLHRIATCKHGSLSLAVILSYKMVRNIVGAMMSLPTTQMILDLLDLKAVQLLLVLKEVESLRLRVSLRNLAHELVSLRHLWCQVRVVLV